MNVGQNPRKLLHLDGYHPHINIYMYTPVTKIYACPNKKVRNICVKLQSKIERDAEKKIGSCLDMHLTLVLISPILIDFSKAQKHQSNK